MNIAETIKGLRNSLGLSKKDFAKKIGVSTVTASTYESDNAKWQPSLKRLEEIAKKCNRKLLIVFVQDE